MTTTEYYYAAGTWPDGSSHREFEWKFDISNPRRSVFKSVIDGTKWKSKQGDDILKEDGFEKFGTVAWSGFDGMEPKKLKELIKKSPSRYQIDISKYKENLLDVKIYLKSHQVINRSVRTSSLTNADTKDVPLNIFFVQTVGELIYLLRTEKGRDFLFRELLNGIANRWSEDFADFNDWQKLVGVFDCLELETQRKIFFKLLSNCKGEDLSLAEQSFERLAAFTHRFCAMSLLSKSITLTTTEIIRVINQAIAFLDSTSGTSIPPALALRCLMDCLTIAVNFDMIDQIKHCQPEIYERIYVIKYKDKKYYQSLELKNKFTLNLSIQIIECIFQKSDNLTKLSSHLKNSIQSQSSDFVWQAFLTNLIKNFPDKKQEKLIVSFFTVLKFYIPKKNLNDLTKFLDNLNETVKNNKFSDQMRCYIDRPYFVYGLIDLAELLLDIYPEKEEVVTKLATLLEIIKAKSTQTTEKLAQVLLRRLFKKKAFLQKNRLLDKDQLQKRMKKLDNLLNIAPLVSKLRTLKNSLEKDSQLARDSEYIIDLHGTRTLPPSSTARKTITELFQELLIHNKTKATLLLGENGSGKTLFLKNYVLQLFKKYVPGKSFPFFVPLISLSDPQKALMQETLDKFELSDCIDSLKTEETVWFLDGFDEMFIEQNREKTNFFLTNQLQDWEHAQFVISCRDTFLASGDEARLIAPLKLMEPLFISSFNKDDIKNFLEKFVSDQWTVKRYRHLISHYDLNEMAANPFNLRIIAETFPKVMKSENINKLPDEMPLYLLFDHWVAHKISDEYARELELMSRLKTLEPTEFLIFAIEISKLMGICQKQSIAKNDLRTLNTGAQITKKEYEKGLSALNEKKKKLSDQSQLDSLEAEIEVHEKYIKQAELAPKKLFDMLIDDESFSTLRRTCFLCTNPKGEIQFIHPLMYKYFRSLENNPTDIDRLKSLINALVDGNTK